MVKPVSSKTATSAPAPDDDQESVLSTRDELLKKLRQAIQDGKISPDMIRPEMIDRLLLEIETEPRLPEMTPAMAADRPLEELCEDMQRPSGSSFGKFIGRRYSYSTELKGEITRRVREQMAAVLQNPRSPGDELLRDFRRVNDDGVKTYEKGTPVRLLKCERPKSEVFGLFESLCTYAIPGQPGESITLLRSQIPFYIRRQPTVYEALAGTRERLEKGRELLVKKRELRSTQEEFERAPVRPMEREKAMFIARLEREIRQLEGEGELWKYQESIEEMKQILKIARATPFYEKQAYPYNGIPAFFVPSGDQPGIVFTRGAFNFLLAYHEAVHAFQFATMNDHSRSFHSHSSEQERSYALMDEGVMAGADQILLEEEDYQMNIAYILRKAGVEPFETESIRHMAANLPRYAPEALKSDQFKIALSDCWVAAGNFPLIYEQVSELIKKVESVPDFSNEERDSALALVLAYSNVEILENGQLAHQPHGLARLVAEFYGADAAEAFWSDAEEAVSEREMDVLP